MTIAGSARDAIVAHALECRPSECCGMIVGQSERILAAVRARNLAEDPNRFLIDPQDHINALRSARSQGLEVIGFYHSHPHSDAYPSPTDLAEAAYAGCVHVIVSLKEEAPDVRAFRLRDGVAKELAVKSLDS